MSPFFLCVWTVPGKGVMASGRILPPNGGVTGRSTLARVDRGRRVMKG
jgi:hypothetical protein